MIFYNFCSIEMNISGIKLELFQHGNQIQGTNKLQTQKKTFPRHFFLEMPWDKFTGRQPEKTEKTKECIEWKMVANPSIKTNILSSPMFKRRKLYYYFYGILSFLSQQKPSDYSEKKSRNSSQRLSVVNRASRSPPSPTTSTQKRRHKFSWLALIWWILLPEFFLFF